MAARSVPVRRHARCDRHGDAGGGATRDASSFGSARHGDRLARHALKIGDINGKRQDMPGGFDRRVTRAEFTVHRRRAAQIDEASEPEFVADGRHV